MKPVIVFGTGDFADIVSYVLEHKMGRSISAYAVHERFRRADAWRDRPLINAEESGALYPPSGYDAVLAVIGKKMFRQREALFQEIREKGYALLNVIDPSASVDTGEIGSGNIILAGSRLEAHCSLGDGNILWQNVVLPHHNRIGSFNNLAPSVSLSGYSSVGDHCFIGNNACIKNRIHIPDWCFIGAGAYVSGRITENTVLVPPRSIALEGKTGFDFL